MSRLVRWLSYGLIAVILLAGGVFLVDRPSDKGSDIGVSVPGGLSVGGKFTLIDEHGATVHDTTYRGRWMLLYFGYTYCPDVCPTELQHIAAALHKLGPQAADIAPLFITVDPQRDTPAVMAKYTKLFDPRIIGLTGTPAEIAAVAKDYRVYYARQPAQGAAPYLMDHSSFMYLMRPDGSLAALFQQGLTPQQLADAIRSKLAES